MRTRLWWLMTVVTLIALTIASLPALAQDGEDTPAPTDPPVEQPTDEPAPTDPPPVEEPAPTEEPAPIDPPVIDEPAPTEPPVIEEPPVVEEPPAEDPIVEEPVFIEKPSADTVSPATEKEALVEPPPVIDDAPLAAPMDTSGDFTIQAEDNDNPSCKDLGYFFGFKIDDNPPSGTYYFTNGEQNGVPTVITIGVQDPDNYVVITYIDGKTVSWTSSIGIDAFIVKGGKEGANVIYYDPEATSGSGATPTLQDISHVEFCYDYELGLSKDANTSYTREYDWTIQKDWDGEYSMFAGGSQTHSYQVSVVQTITDYDFQVTGSITINNPSPVDASVSVSDALNGFSAPVTCPSDTVPAKGSLICAYDTGKQSTNVFGSVNTATIASSTSGVNGGTATASVIFGEPTTVVGNPTIGVTDTNGQSWSAGATDSWSYTKDFTCSSNPADYTNGYYWYDLTNTATITQTGLNDTAYVKVNCYAPVVTKSAAASYDERHSWDIEKSVDPTAQSGFPGDILPWTWTVTLNESFVEENFLVSGQIFVQNPAPMQMTVSLSDALNDGTAAAITGCTNGGYSAPNLTVPANTTATCSYTANPIGRTATENTATATLNGIGFSGSAEVSFVKNVLNGTANVDDDQESDFPLTVSMGEGPWTWTETQSHTCSSDLAAYGESGSYSGTVDNAATVTGSNGQTDSADAYTTYTCYIPSIEKTAAGTYDERHEWDVEKTVYPTSQSAFAGETVPFNWTIDVTEEIFEETFAVSGTITVANPNPEDTLVVALTDVLDDGTVPTIGSCEGGTYTDGTLTVPAGSIAQCSYSAAPAGRTATKNTASFSLGGILFSHEDPIEWTPNVIRGSATLDDEQYPYSDESVDDGWTSTYADSYTCSSDVGDYTDGANLGNQVSNTAEVYSDGELQDSSTAVTTIDCYAPVVTKNADTSFTRTWSWTIDKTGDQTDLTLSVGQQFLVNYTVLVDATYTDSDWAVNGTIRVVNPAPMPMPITLTDVISPNIIVTPDCPDFDGSIAAGDTLVCTYGAPLQDASSRTNTATATLNGIAFEGQADVIFGDPTEVVDECVDVTDDQYGSLGTVCANEAPKTFSYSMYVGPYDVCEMYQLINIASFVTNDTGATGEDSWTVNVDVPCDGCTLTPGYWKTHSTYGPAPYDETWALIGEGTPFFLSGQSYYEVLWTNPFGGNAYYILAHAYIAAELNFLNGADPSAAQAAFDEATALFETYTPEYVAALKGKAGNTLRAQFVSLATILDDYNNGYIGPGHCDE